MDITRTERDSKRESVSSKAFWVTESVISESISSRQKITMLRDSKDTYDEFSEHMTDLQNNNITSPFIIDLRNNPGGDLDIVTKNRGLSFLPEGVITYTEDKTEKKYFNSDAKSVDLPMVVLVNGEAHRHRRSYLVRSKTTKSYTRGRKDFR